MRDNSTFATAFKLLTLGFSVIPSGGRDKHKSPLVNWTEYQRKIPTEGELAEWNADKRPLLWGMVTGAISGVVVVDADTPEARGELEGIIGEPNVITPRGGGHWYFKHPGHRVKTTVGILPQVDVRADGGFVNVVGKRPDGEYKILTLPHPDSLIPWERLPERLRQALNSSKLTPKAKQGAPIAEGQRNAALASIAGAMRRRGANQGAIEAALLEINTRQCKPPLPEQEVLVIAGSVSRYEPKPDADQTHYNLTDYGNAERLVSPYGDVIHYSPERKAWLIWIGKVWEWDLGGIRIAELAKKTVRNIYREAADEPDDNLRKELVKHARASERQVRIDAMVKSAESEPGVAVRLADLDTNHWLLNVNNGTIDLETGVLKPHDPADLITEILPIGYDPEATSTEWDTFLHRIFSDNGELIAFVQRSLGYSITGDQSEQVFFFCYGGGFNGKSTLLNACRSVLGNYATQIPPTAFMVDKSKRGGPDEAIASLANKRLVCSTELEGGQRLSVSLVKRMTGGEPLWCEHKFERGYNFQPTHKLWLSGNHEPRITDSSNSIWYRLKKIPFTLEIPEAERKKGYYAKLAAEHGIAILAWLVQGCMAWRQTGSLGEPEAVRQAVAEYRDREDILHDFLMECCLFKKSENIDQKDLYKAYKTWCADNDRYLISQPNFSEKIREKGAIAGRGHGNKATWQGIRALTDEERVNAVNQVNDFSISSLREANTVKTLHKIINPVNPINPTSLDNPPSADDLPPEYPRTPCPACGGSDPWLTGWNQWLCSSCYSELRQREGKVLRALTALGEGENDEDSIEQREVRVLRALNILTYG